MEKNEGLLVGYFVAGDPCNEKFQELVTGVVGAGIDILEIGMPSINPIYDGDVIRRGHIRALDNQDNVLYQNLQFWKQLRSITEVPIWIMGYENDIVKTGLYLELSRERLIDALVLPDCSIDTLKKIAKSIEKYETDIIHFVNPSMLDAELIEIVSETPIIYAQLYKGATGDSSAKQENLSSLYNRIRKFSNSGIIAGFGINSPDKVQEVIGNGFDGVVVGSAFVSKWEHGEKDSLYKLIADMKSKTKKGNMITEMRGE